MGRLAHNSISDLALRSAVVVRLRDFVQQQQRRSKQTIGHAKRRVKNVALAQRSFLLANRPDAIGREMRANKKEPQR
jgi:hypothetical protein